MLTYERYQALHAIHIRVMGEPGNEAMGISLSNRCQVKMGTPPNGDPGSPFSYEIGDPGPQFSNILGTPGSPISYGIRDPSMKLGTPIFFFCSGKFCHHHAINTVGHFNFS